MLYPAVTIVSQPHMCVMRADVAYCVDEEDDQPCSDLV